MTNIHPFPPQRPPWWNRLVMGERGPLSNYANAYIALSSDAATSDAIGYDEMLRMPMMMRQIGGLNPVAPAGDYPRPVKDADVREMQKWMQEAGLRSMGYDNVYGAVLTYASQRAYDPALEYLESLTWDEEPRIDIWLAKYLGVANSPYASMVGKLFLISMVARIFEPGCKADYMLVLEGPQGELKSQALRILGDPWFSDNLPDIATHAKDAAVHLRGKWLLEIPEMHAFNKAETTHLKSFVSRQEEFYRPPYGRAEVIDKRRCVFAGTTNKEAYLKDETGGRRFWPVKCGTIRLELLEAERDQLFAEAMVAYLAGTHWWPERKFEMEFIKPHQTARYEGDLWEDLMREYLDGKSEVTLKQIAVGCLGYEDNNGNGMERGTPLNRFGTADQNRVKRALSQLGWTKSERLNAQNQARFVPLKTVS